MTLTIELPPEFERRLEEEAARHGQAPAEFVRAAVEEKLGGPSAAEQREAQLRHNQASLALLRQWRKEDAEDPDPNPLPVVPPLSLRKVRID